MALRAKTSDRNRQRGGFWLRQGPLVQNGATNPVHRWRRGVLCMRWVRMHIRARHHTLPKMGLPLMMCPDICSFQCTCTQPSLNWRWRRPSLWDKCPLSHRPHCYNPLMEAIHFQTPPVPLTFTFFTFSTFSVSFVCRLASSPCSPSPHFFPLFCVAALFPLRVATYTFPHPPSTGSLRQSFVVLFRCKDMKVAKLSEALGKVLASAKMSL